MLRLQEQRGHPKVSNQQSHPLPPGALIQHPLLLLFWLIWLVNDHLLKDWFANELTGKVSDVASLVVFPLLPYTLYELAQNRWGWRFSRNWVLLLSLIATGSVMVGINISETWAACYRFGLGSLQWPFLCAFSWINGQEMPPIRPVQLTMDPSDVWTLPALFIPWSLSRSKAEIN